MKPGDLLVALLYLNPSEWLVILFCLFILLVGAGIVIWIVVWIVRNAFRNKRPSSGRMPSYLPEYRPSRPKRRKRPASRRKEKEA